MRVLVTAGLVTIALRWRRQPGSGHTLPPSTRVVLILLLVELRSGQSVLAAIQGASRALADHDGLSSVARLASVGGLAAAVSHAPDGLRSVVAQLARAQRSGSSLSGTVRRLIEDDLAEERSRRLARAKSLPTRLMVPVTLLMLPGLVVLLYAPSLLGLYQDLLGAWP